MAGYSKGMTDRADEVVPCQTLLDALRGAVHESGRDLVTRAYAFAEAAHAGQRRASGGPFFEHPSQVALLLAHFGMDPVGVAAGLLHDVPEDTERTCAEVAALFGEDVAQLVDGVTKLSSFGGINPELVQAESVRKMFLAMATDLRVVVIKLADRLNNMRTLGSLPEEKRRRISKQTLEIYAPLAYRIGMRDIAGELEDLAFSHLDPEHYREISEQLGPLFAQRGPALDQAASLVQAALGEAGISASVMRRRKRVYSTVHKMHRVGRDIAGLYDLLALRIVVADRDTCYRVLGLVHSLWPPIPGQFDDYIALPKANLYQSLHTAVIGPQGAALEVQIRTREMNAVAETGIAAHYHYKEAGDAGEAARPDLRYESKLAWVRQILDWHEDAADATAFVDALRLDLFHDQVFVFTPKGEVRELPAGACALDFAYRIHTTVGHQALQARINGRVVPLSEPLRTGDLVEILTDPRPSGPLREWLGFVRTATARERIRQYFKRQDRAENIRHGQDLLHKACERLAARLPSARDLEALAAALEQPDVETMLAAIGYGGISSVHAAATLGVTDDTGLRLPLAAESGIRAGTLRPAASFCVYPVSVTLLARDRDGLLRDVAEVVTSRRVRMTALTATAQDDKTAELHLALQVTSVEELEKLIDQLGHVRSVLRVGRSAV